jgi:hypothetical protein
MKCSSWVAHIRKQAVDFLVTLTMGNKTTTVSGLVIPTEWDDNGTIRGAAIFDREERQHVIQQDEIGRQLLTLIHEDVEVLATITREGKGQTILKVKNFWLKTGDDKRGADSLYQKGGDDE